MTQMKLRHIKFLNLLANQESYKPAGFFGDVFGVSTKTIFNDIKALNYVLKDYDLLIDKIPRRGICLTGNNANLDAVYLAMVEANETLTQKDYPVLRQVEIVKGSLIDGKLLKTRDIERKFFVSSTSVRKDVEVLHEWFARFNIDVKIVRNAVVFCGKESDIQTALKQYIFDTVVSQELDSVYLDYNPLLRLMHQLFDENLVEVVGQEVDGLAQYSEKKITNWFRRSLHIALLIQVMRIRNGFHMTQDDVRFNKISHLEPFMITIDLIERYERNYGLVFFETDACYLNQQLLAHGIEPTVKKTALLDRYEGTVRNMIATMSQHLRVDLSDDEKLRQSLLAHLPPMIYRLKHNVAVKNPLLEEIRNKYIVLFSLTWYVSIGFEEQFDVKLTDDEISFIFIYFQIALDRKHQGQPQNIIIVCPYGLATSELIYERVRHIMPSTRQLNVMTTEELSKTNLEDVDMIISTVKLDIESPPVMYVSPLMDGHDIEKILKFAANKAMNIQSHDEEAFLEFIDEKLIFCKDNCKTKKEALDKMIGVFECCEYVNEAFREKVFAREAMGDTGLATGVAIPHGFPETVKESRIGIMTLNKAINWGAHPVDVIVLLSLSSHDVPRVKPILATLMRLLESHEFIQHLRQAKTKDEILTLIGGD